MWWHSKRIDVVTFKLMGVLPEYRRRGIDAMIYLDMLRAMYDKGYEWLDGSLTDEANLLVNLVAGRLGAERYKHYRVYQKPCDPDAVADRSPPLDQDVADNLNDA
jgi:hypothetical protein